MAGRSEEKRLETLARFCMKPLGIGVVACQFMCFPQEVADQRCGDPLGRREIRIGLPEEGHSVSREASSVGSALSLPRDED
jgi:hypothetical protein